MIAADILNRLAARLVRELAPPAQRLRPWIVAGHAAGALDDRRGELLRDYDEVFTVSDTSIALRDRFADARSRSTALDRVARDLSLRGELTRWRDERYPVVGASGETLLLLERSAARFFGIHTLAAHVNGTTRRDGGTRIWIARRSATKAIDPGLLDNLVGGGVAAGLDVADTIVKECDEEAGIPAPIARTARHRGTVAIRRMQKDGLHRETIHVHDLELPAPFAPTNRDGEVSEFRLVGVEQLAAIAANDRGADVMTADATLVVADWLVRSGHIARDSEPGTTIDRLRRAASGAIG